jgi:hypothetical protein
VEERMPAGYAYLHRRRRRPWWAFLLGLVG